MRLVVTCQTLAVVRSLGTAATRTQIDDTCVVAGIGIRAVGILIVAVGIVIVDVLQCRLVFSFRHIVAVAGTQVVFVEVVCHPAIFEVIVCITLFGSTIHSIDDRGGASYGCCTSCRCGAWSRIILKAAVVGTIFVIAKGSDIAVFQTEIVNLSLVLQEECLVLAEAFQHMTVAMEGSPEHGTSSIDILSDGQVALEDKLGIGTAIIILILQVFLESRQVLLVLDVDARLRKILWLTLSTSLCCLLCTLHSLRNMQVHLVRLRIHLLIVVNHQGIG